MKISKLTFIAFIVAIISGNMALSAEYTPTRGNDAVYTLKNDAASSNTGMSVTVPTYDNNGNMTGTQNKYLDIKKTQYSDGKIQYTFDESTGLTPTYTTGEGTGVNYLLRDTHYSATTITDPENTTYSSPHVHNQNGYYRNFEAKNNTTYSLGSENEKSVFMNNTLTGNVINDTEERVYVEYHGGLIRNASEVTKIIADFIGNSSYGTINGERDSDKGSSSFYGGNIYNTGTIAEIVGDFIGNSSDRGSAIYNKGSSDYITSIKGNFIGNNGGAIYTNSAAKIGSIEGNFIGNNGGAIYIGEYSIVDSISGDFIGNKDSAIYFYDAGTFHKIKSIQGDFINNETAITDINGNITKISGNFINNTNSAIISNNIATIDEIEGNFIGNGARSYYGGAIYYDPTMSLVNAKYGIGSIKGNFIENTADTYGGAIYDNGYSDLTVEGDFRGNTVGSAFNGNGITPRGGAIYKSRGNLIVNDSSFINNTANDGDGGAILGMNIYGMNNNIVINAINKDVLFSGNQAN